MTFTSDLEILRLYDGVLNCSLAKAEWSHAAHFAVAVAILADQSHAAFHLMPDHIRAYNVATGVPNNDQNGYHHTITVASLRATQNRMEYASSDEAMFEVVNDLVESEFGNPNWLLSYWRKDNLFSVEARRGWVDPDIKPLPF